MAFDNEKDSLRAFIGFAMAAGAASFSVYDGEEWPLKNSANVEEIIAACNSTGEDSVQCNDAEGKRLASFFLVWGNAEDGSELLADHGVNPWADNVWRQWFDKSEEA